MPPAGGGRIVAGQVQRAPAGCRFRQAVHRIDDRHVRTQALHLLKVPQRGGLLPIADDDGIGCYTGDGPAHPIAHQPLLERLPPHVEHARAEVRLAEGAVSAAKGEQGQGQHEDRQHSQQGGRGPPVAGTPARHAGPYRSQAFTDPQGKDQKRGDEKSPLARQVVIGGQKAVQNKTAQQEQGSGRSAA